MTQIAPTHTQHDFDSLPIPLSSRNWGGWVAAAVAATAGVATWSFVMGGFTAYYVTAREGTATMIAGALIGQLLVTLSQVPAVTKYGIETLGSTKPQLGVRGSLVALIVQYMTLVGWNLVLTIFLGRAVASVLVSAGVITQAQSGSTAVIASICGAGLVWILLQWGSDALKSVGVVVAGVIVVIGVWMYFLLLSNFTVGEILAAEPIAPDEGGRLTNYTIGVELLILGTLGWWAYMGALFRMMNHAGKGVVPSMISLGFGWAAVGLIGLYSGLISGEADPTIWILQIAGPTAGVFVLIFIALANLGSTLVGSHAAALGVGQFTPATQQLSWNAKLATAIVPMAIVIVLFPGAFYDNIGTFMAFIGIIIAPMVGVQSVDWFVLRRLDTLHVPSLYWSDDRSHYWYSSGFNIVGIAALACGALTYTALLNPLTFVPNSDVFQYTTATLPAAAVGALVYWIGATIFFKERREVR
jgi:nucleobase:cation symporter-1, NCS1 family